MATATTASVKWALVIKIHLSPDELLAPENDLLPCRLLVLAVAFRRSASASYAV
jgi:hypothetical protein